MRRHSYLCVRGWEAALILGWTRTCTGGPKYCNSKIERFASLCISTYTMIYHRPIHLINTYSYQDSTLPKCFPIFSMWLKFCRPWYRRSPRDPAKTLACCRTPCQGQTRFRKSSYITHQHKLRCKGTLVWESLHSKPAQSHKDASHSATQGKMLPKGIGQWI